MNDVVSVIIPALPPRIDRGWLKTAIDSITAQQKVAVDFQIIVGIEPDSARPQLPQIDHCVEATTQAHKVNLAAERAEGRYLAILHDDDLWHPAFLNCALEALENVDFVSSNSVEVDEVGGVVDITDFPCPSGWLTTREIFREVGPFDPTYRIHCDTEWLGRLGLTPSVKSRAHLVEAQAPQPMIRVGNEWHYNQITNRPSMRMLLNHARPEPRIIHTNYPVPLVTRRLHNDGILKREESELKWQVEGNWEYSRMTQRYNRVPW
ncbi:MAG: glycosyltransferase family 2 protein [Alphaproteobacteria bacterium]|nr:glycosyltransferase family 2 protein [Alphaproteobacteria bacterium]